jgi:lipopolysaccharide export system protein LptA
MSAWRRAGFFFPEDAMSCVVRSWVVAATMLALLAWAPAGRAEVELTAATKVASADARVTTYTGNVTLKVPAGTQMLVRAQAMRREGGVEILRGEVEIKVEALLVRSSQATVERNSKQVIVKMEAAEVSKAD